MITSSFVQVWYPFRYFGSSCGKEKQKSHVQLMLHISLIRSVRTEGVFKHLWEMESEVCDQVFPWGHIEPELPPEDHQVRCNGLVA